MATYYCVATGTWSNANTSIWSTTSGGASGAGPPTSGDTVVFDNNSGASGAAAITVTTALCNAISMTSGFTGSFIGSGSLTIGDAVGFNGIGNVTFSPNMTFNTAIGIILQPLRSPFTCNFTSGGVVLGQISAQQFVVVNQQDNLSCGALILLAGITWNTNNHTVTCVSFNMQSALGAKPTYNMGSTVMNVTGGGVAWTIVTSGGAAGPPIINAGTSLVHFTNGGGFTGLGETLNNVQTSSGTPLNIEDANNTFNAVTIDANATLEIAHGQTLTISNIISGGTAGHLASIVSDSPGVQGSFATSNAIVVDYVSIKDSHGTGAGSYTALCHSVNAGDNTNWTFITPCPNDSRLPTLSSPCSQP